jgi:hypothetical protein
VVLYSSSEYTVPFAYLILLSDWLFPASYRRGFWGPQVEHNSEAYLRAVDRLIGSYVDAMLANGDTPSTSTRVLQYMFPGLNGNLSASDTDTAWLHSSVGHQILFDPGWRKASSDGVATAFNKVLFRLADLPLDSNSSSPRNDSTSVWRRNESRLYHYPNYIKPSATGDDVWGSNTARLAMLKQKYDTQCKIHNGGIFASQRCLSRGFANVF